MKVFRYLFILVLLIVRLNATITPTTDVYGPQIPASFTATLTTGIAFQQASDLLIVNAGQPGAVRTPATVLKLGVDYVVTGGGYNSANQMQVGNFTLTNTGPNSPITGDNLYVVRNVPANQLTVFANGGYLTAAMIEQALDKQATLAQMTVNNGMASLHVETYETANAIPPKLLMTKNARSGNLVGFDANGNVAFYPVSGGSGGSGIQSVSGTTNQVIAVTTNNAVTLSTPQNIDTTATPQFAGLGIGTSSASNAPVNFQPTATASSGALKAERHSPIMTASANGDTIYNFIEGGSINGGSYTGLNYYGITIGQPTLASGTLSNSYALYFNTGPAATNKYGLYQSGTDKNVLNNLTLAAGGGGGITFADGTVQTTAGGGSSGVTQIVAGTGIAITPTGGTGIVTINATGTAGVTTATGTANQVLVNSTSGSAQTGAITLTTPQNIDTAANVQFGTLGIGTAVGAGNGVNLQPTVTASAGQSKGLRISPSITQAANGDVIYDEILGGTINSNSFTSGSIYELTLGSPTVTGSFTNGYQLYLSGLSSGTFTNKYGIYQAGTEPNVFSGSLQVPSLTIGSLSGLLKATSGSVSTASSGIDYAPATSGTSILYGNGSGGFSNVTVSTGLSFSGGVLTATGGTGTVTSVSGTGTVNGITLTGTVTTSGSLTLGGTLSGVSLTSQVSGTLPVANGGTGVTTSTGSGSTVLSASPTFTGTVTTNGISNTNDLTTTTLEVGTTATAGVGVSLQPSVTSSAGNAKGVRTTPALTAAANSDSLYSNIFGGTVTNASYTGVNYYELALGAPTVSGSYTNGYQLYLSGLSSGTFSNKYGIYQAGTEPNVFGGAVTVPNFTATGTTTLATSLTGYLSASSGIVSASSTIPTSALSGQVSVSNGGTGASTLTGYVYGNGTSAMTASTSIPTSALSGTINLGTQVTGTLSASNGGSGVAGTITGYVYANGTSAHTASTTIPTSALSGTISNAQLANSSVTVTAGTGLGGGGAVSLGSSVTLTNAGVTSLTGTSNQVNVSASTGGVTLSTPQSIATSSSPQFNSLGIGVAASGTAGDLYANTTFEVGTPLAAGVGVNFQPSVTASSNLAKGFRLSPALTAAANSDSIYTQIVGGTVTNSSYSGVGYQELALGSPTISGTFATAYQLYLSGFSSGTLTSKYGIYQAGTEQNYFAGALNVASGSRGATNQNLTPATTTISSTTIDWSQGNSFYKTLSANTTFTFSNAVDGQVITICLLNTTSNYTVTWPSMKWAGGTAPTMTTGAHYDVYTIYYNATVGAYFGSYVQNF